MTDSTSIPLSEAAFRLKKSWTQAWRLVLTGELSGTKIGGRWYVTVDSVNTYKEKHP